MKDKEYNTIILARVSSKAQEDEGYSLDAQFKLLQSYCMQRQLRVVKTFRIAETASKEQSRKVFHELLIYLKDKDIFHLAVEKTDRLTRNFKDAVAIDEWLEQDDRRRLHAVKESLLLHKEAKSDVKFMWNIHLSVAKKYSDNLREEAMKGWAEKLAQGWLPTTPPPGYMTTAVNGKKIHVPDPSRQSQVRRAFEKYLEPDQSIATVCEEMKLMGLTTRKGRPYSKSHVQSILVNPFYIGVNRFNGKDYPGAQQTFISEDLFNRVQLKMRRKLSGKYRTHNPVFKSLIVCTSCERMVTWQLQKGRYYGACQRKNSECRTNSLLREDALEEKVQTMLSKLVSPSEQVIDWVAEAMRSRQQTVTEANEQLAASVQAQIDRINRMDSNLYDDKLSGEISPHTYTEKHQEFTAQRMALEDKLSKVDQTIGSILEQKIVLFKLSQKAADIYSHKSATQKRLIISKLFKQFKYEKGVVSVSYTNFAQAIANKVLETHKILGGEK